MADEPRYLLALEGRDGTRFVLEFDSQHYLKGKQTAADNLDIWNRRITEADLNTEAYREARHYRMRDPVACKIFYLEQWTNFLKLKSDMDIEVAT